MTHENKTDTRQRLAEVRKGRAIVAKYRFGETRKTVEADGSVGYGTTERTVYLVKLVGSEHRLWLSPEDRRRVLEALATVSRDEDIAEGLKPPVADEGGDGVSPSVGDRVWVHHCVEHLVANGRMPDPLEFAEDPVGTLAEAGIAVPGYRARARLLLSEVHRAMRRTGRQSLLTEFDGPVDPYGELAGPRGGVTRWVCKRRHRRRGKSPSGVEWMWVRT